MASAICFNLDQPKILLSAYGSSVSNCGVYLEDHRKKCVETEKNLLPITLFPICFVHIICPNYVQQGHGKGLKTMSRILKYPNTSESLIIQCAHVPQCILYPLLHEMVHHKNC